MPLEKEIKFEVADPAGLRNRVESLGAIFQDRYFEENVVYDDPTGSLFHKGQLLRLRKDRGILLTFKRPASEQDSSQVKILHEIQTRVDDFQAMDSILGHLGMERVLGYEKVRELWISGSTEICLDQLPFGFFVEFEGPEEEILVLAGRMGFDPCTGSKKTYHEFHQEYLERHELPPRMDFVFEEAQRRRLKDEIG